MNAAEEFPIRLTEELLLLMLNEHSGYLETVPGWDFSCVMAGAVIADLALANRIDTDLTSLYLVDATPTGDELLDSTLKDIGEADETLETQYWIERNTVRFRRHRHHHARTSWWDKGILDYESGGFWTLSSAVSRSRMYPTAGGKTPRGGESQGPGRCPERHHSRPARRDPRQPDAHVRRVQAVALRRRLSGEARTHRACRQDGSSRPVGVPKPCARAPSDPRPAVSFKRNPSRSCESSISCGSGTCLPATSRRRCAASSSDMDRSSSCPSRCAGIPSSR